MNLEFKNWGKRWFEALPLGNGHLGAMIYGNPCRERIALSENTFFSGDNKTDNNQKGAKDVFYKMRKSITEGKHQEALAEAKNFIGIRGNYGTNIPVGSILIDYGLPENRIGKYKRGLNLNNGVFTASFEYQNNSIETECFVSHPDKLLVYQMKSSDGSFNPTIQMKAYSDISDIEYSAEYITFQTSARENMHSDGTSGTDLMGIIKIVSDGRTEYNNEKVTITKASYFRLYVKMITDFDNPEFEQQSNRYRTDKNTLVRDEYNAYKARHMKDMEHFMTRSQLKLYGDRQEELDTVSTMYQYGRYLLLSSSREDSKLPAHLQGIWNDNVACRIGWTCDMHLDINTQMNYWPAEVTNLQEVTDPLFRWIRQRLVPDGTESAWNNYGLKGWVAEIVSNSWGFTAPYWAEPISPCPTGGVWIATHMWEHFLYSGDLNYLKEIFPVLYEAARFFSEYVFWDADLNYYMSGPAISPENSFLSDDGKKYQMDNGCTYEMIMIRELFRIFLEGARKLQLQDELVDKVSGMIGKLLPYPVLGDGSIGEWSRDYKENDPQHRHTSHLLGLYPFHQITQEKTPELVKAAKRTIEKKLEREEQWEDTGWARNMLILYAARLQDGNKAYYHIQRLMKNLLETNFLVYHPPTRGAMSFDNVYELDGNTGLTSAIAEMLLQSHDGMLHILPALPREWKSGYVKGLRARGNIVADISWVDGKVEFVRLFSDRNTLCKVKYNNMEQECRLKEKQEEIIQFGK